MLSRNAVKNRDLKGVHLIPNSISLNTKPYHAESEGIEKHRAIAD
jgi:hypothetical protein